MHTEINVIIQQLFREDDAGQVTDAALETLLSKYPYLSVARYLAAWRKYRQANDETHEELITAGLYLNNPMWLQWLLENHPEDAAPPGKGVAPTLPADAGTAEDLPPGSTPAGEDSDAPGSATEFGSQPQNPDAIAVNDLQHPEHPASDPAPPSFAEPIEAEAEKKSFPDTDHHQPSGYIRADATTDQVSDSPPLDTDGDQSSGSVPTGTETEEPAASAQESEPLQGSSDATTDQVSDSIPLDTDGDQSSGSVPTDAADNESAASTTASHEGQTQNSGTIIPGTGAQDKKDAATEQPVNSSQRPQGDAFPIVFQSYHTIDYFASQGIRLQQADLTKDRFGQQLKSFTDWLRSMKKLPHTEAGPAVPEDAGRQQLVIRNAASSLEDREVYTEAMAEVWAKQGNTEKALSIYEKLSLLNPSKSTYFAAKIDQLKAV